MSLPTKDVIKLELLWWLVTLVIVAGVMLPIYLDTIHYAFYGINIIYIVTFVTLTRYVFLLKFTFLARRQILKIALFFISIPFIFYLIQELNAFQTFLDENGPEALTGANPGEADLNKVSYIRTEFLLFGVGAIISAVLFPLRLILSVWRTRNRGTV